MSKTFLRDDATVMLSRLMCAKLAALRVLGRYIGMYGPVSEQERKQRAAAVDPEWLLLIAHQLLNAPEPWQRAACALVLEYHLPGWRETAPLAAFGYIVERNDPEVRAWRVNVLSRDGHRCIDCGATERLEAHHIAGWADCPELRVVVQNGVTVCWACHLARHGRAAATS